MSKHDINIASDSMNKGIVRDGKELIAWDCIQTCQENCPIYSTCTYQALSKDKCSLQIAYLDNLTKTIFATYRYCNDEVLFKVGMHLVPLYSQLCRQKIVEKSVMNLAYEDLKGTTRIHPIYKEIRETLKCITLIWKEMGFAPVMDASIPIIGRPGFGNPNHYENICQGADNKRDVIR